MLVRFRPSILEYFLSFTYATMGVAFILEVGTGIAEHSFEWGANLGGAGRMSSSPENLGIEALWKFSRVVALRDICNIFIALKFSLLVFFWQLNFDRKFLPGNPSSTSFFH